MSLGQKRELFGQCWVSFGHKWVFWGHKWGVFKTQVGIENPRMPNYNLIKKFGVETC